MDRGENAAKNSIDGCRRLAFDLLIAVYWNSTLWASLLHISQKFKPPLHLYFCSDVSYEPHHALHEFHFRGGVSQRSSS